MARIKQTIDLDELARQIRDMSVRSQLYKVLKHELSARGWWKNRIRGKADIKHIDKHKKK